MKGHRIDVDSFWLPRAGSTLAADVDFGWTVVLVVSLVLFALVVGTMLVFVWRFRRRGAGVAESSVEHNTKLEIVWTAIPLIVVMALFGIGLRGYMSASIAPGESIQIMVTAEKWLWRFTYPDGRTTVNDLRVPVNRPVKLVMSSKDVLHSLFIPEFRVKQDVVPGTYTTLWFEATQLGTTTLSCTQYCGTGHSDMLATVHVLDQAEYVKWVQTGGEDSDEPPAKRGEALYSSLGCVACHSLDGSARVGPTFKGLFGRPSILADGAKQQVDEAYIRESILKPNAKLVQGFQPVMPTFQGTVSDKQLDALLAFIKSVK